MTDDTLILDAVEAFLEREVRPVAQMLEAADEYPHQIVESMRRLGLFGATVSQQYGGLGLSAELYSRIVERVSAVWMSVSGIFNSHLILCAAVERFGTEDMKDTWLPRLASGELRGGIALTEPGCGTDLQAIRTTARRTADGYRIDGSKQWITNAAEGNVLAVLVKTDPDAQPRHRGISLLLVERSAGYKANKLKKLGYRGVDTAEVVFDGVEVARDQLVGGVEGRGLQQILSGLALGRINVAARGVGVAQASLDAATRYAQQRETFGQPICNHQSIQIKLADMVTRVAAARALTRQAAGAYDTGERCDLEAGMAKLAATEAAVSNSMEAMRVFGAYGYSPDNLVERYYRDAPLLAIGEGTNELQRILISRQWIERNPA